MDYFDKWLEITAVKTKEELWDLMILDQFLYQLPQEIRLLIKDHYPKTVKEAPALVDEFSLTRLKPQIRNTKEHYKRQSYKTANYKKENEKSSS